MEFNSMLHLEQLTQEFRMPEAQKRAGQWSIKAEELYKLQSIISGMEKLKDKLTEELKELSDGQSSTDGSFLYNKIMRKGSVEYNRIPELEYVDLELYRKKEVESWKLTKI